MTAFLAFSSRGRNRFPDAWYPCLFYWSVGMRDSGCLRWIHCISWATAPASTVLGGGGGVGGGDKTPLLWHARERAPPGETLGTRLEFWSQRVVCVLPEPVKMKPMQAMHSRFICCCCCCCCWPWFLAVADVFYIFSSYLDHYCCSYQRIRCLRTCAVFSREVCQKAQRRKRETAAVEWTKTQTCYLAAIRTDLSHPKGNSDVRAGRYRGQLWRVWPNPSDACAAHGLGHTELSQQGALVSLYTNKYNNIWLDQSEITGLKSGALHSVPFIHPSIHPSIHSFIQE